MGTQNKILFFNINQAPSINLAFECDDIPDVDKIVHYKWHSNAKCLALRK